MNDISAHGPPAVLYTPGEVARRLEQVMYEDLDQRVATALDVAIGVDEFIKYGLNYLQFGWSTEEGVVIGADIMLPVDVSLVIERQAKFLAGNYRVVDEQGNSYTPQEYFDVSG